MPSFYVYRVFDGFETVYVGKGTGRRINNQARRFGLPAEIIEQCTSDDHAFKRERHWIEVLKPTQNKTLGGEGGRSQPVVKSAALKAVEREYAETVKLIGQFGSRKYVAMALTKLLASEPLGWCGLSKVDMIRIAEVANGPRC